MERGKKCAFSAENWPYLGNNERKPKLLLVTSKKGHKPTLFQIS